MADARLVEGSNVRLICEALETTTFDVALVVTALRALRQIRKMFDVGNADHATLVAAIQALLERHSRLVAERRASELRPVIRTIGPVNDGDCPAPDSRSPAGSAATGGRGGGK
jgi:hypothetical protein